MDAAPTRWFRTRGLGDTQASRRWPTWRPGRDLLRAAVKPADSGVSCSAKPNGHLYDAAVVNVEERRGRGPRLACFDDTANGQACTLGQFEEVKPWNSSPPSRSGQVPTASTTRSPSTKPNLRRLPFATGRQNRPTPRGPRWRMSSAATSAIPAGGDSLRPLSARACRSPWAACWPTRTRPGRSSPSSVPPARGSPTRHHHPRHTHRRRPPLNLVGSWNTQAAAARRYVDQDRPPERLGVRHPGRSAASGQRRDDDGDPGTRHGRDLRPRPRQRHRAVRGHRGAATGWTGPSTTIRGPGNTTSPSSLSRA